MSQSDITFRVFISSTFSDMIAERDALQENTFRRLQDYCKRRGARFQAIDLRWGVSEEAALDQETMDLCLGELRRCQRVTPRPNFLVLLGQRYGWCPLPPRIPSSEYEQIGSQIDHAPERMELERWYRRDDNAVPPEYYLQPVPKEEAGEWPNVERRLRSVLLAAVNRLGWAATDLRRTKYEASATHQEIIEGALNAPDATSSVFVYLRSIQGLPVDDRGRDFVDIADHCLDTEAQIRLSALKAELKRRLPTGHIHEYSAQWRGNQPIFDLGALCARVEGDLRTVIDSVLNASTTLDSDTPQIEERTGAHDQFLDERIQTGRTDAHLYSGPPAVLQAISDYLSSPSKYPLAICAEPGAGKSVLFARAIERAREQHPASRIVVRFVGATPESVVGQALLSDLCQELGQIIGEPQGRQPTGVAEIISEFRRRFNLAADITPVIVFLEGLEQLTGPRPIQSLEWVPRELPPNAHLVVSTLDNETVAPLKAMLPNANLILLHARRVIERSRCEELLDRELRSARRTLQGDQRSEVLSKLEKTVNPLYARVFLKFAFEEVTRWHSYDGIPLYQNKRGFSADISGILHDVLWRLGIGKHDIVLVGRCLGYLSTSRAGLAEDELLDVLSGDLDVYERFFNSSFHCPPDLASCLRKHIGESCLGEPIEAPNGADHPGPLRSLLAEMRDDRAKARAVLARVLTQPDGPRLPVIIWTRLHTDISPYLTTRILHGTRVSDLFHREFRSVLEEFYLSRDERKECHKALAAYFARQPLQIKRDGGPVPNERRSFELEYQRERLAELRNTQDS